MKIKKTIFLISTVLLISAIFVLLLFLNYKDKANYQFNSFSRLFLEDPPIDLLGTLDVKVNSFYIAGANSEYIYFGNVKVPSVVLVTNTFLADTQYVRITIDNQENFKYRSIGLKVDSPYFFLFEGTIPIILRGEIANWHGSPTIQQKHGFIESLPISGSSFIIRKIEGEPSENRLGKTMNWPPYSKITSHLLENQLDGVFSTDGMLHVSKKLGWLVYVYYYRNQFIVADTSLNLVYRGNTIDTVSHAKIKLGEVKSDNKITLSSPPLVVNKKSSVSNKWLFINSNLLARNENEEMFEKSSVIDVYNLKDNKYEFSFYLPAYKDKKVREFKVFGNRMIALYDHYVLQFRLNSKYFSSDNQQTAETDSNTILKQVYFQSI